MPRWYHVTPLFHVPNIFDQGGLVCGADVEADRLPRRESSKRFDNQPLDGLNGKRVADCILLYLKRKPMNNLLLNKICGKRDGGTWRCYPHVVLRFDSDECLSLLQTPVWGASANVGRSLRDGTEPGFTHYSDNSSMMSDGVQEILILAESIPDRMLPLAALDSIEVFSKADQQLVQSFLDRTALSGIQVALSIAQQRVSDYTAGQLSTPGSEYLRMHKELFAAIEKRNDVLRRTLVKQLACECFD